MSKSAPAPAPSPDLSFFDKYHFEPQPKAQKIINELVADFLSRCPGAAALAGRMKDDTGTRFADWVESIPCPPSPALKKSLLASGFTSDPQPGAAECFEHKKAIFPRIVFHASKTLRATIKVDSVADFAATQGLTGPEHEIQGEPLGQYRRVCAFAGNGPKGAAELWAAERHGWRGFTIPDADPAKSLMAARHHEAFRRRHRDFDSDAKGFDLLHRLIDAAVRDIGRDWACDLFFYSEREYWQRRNRAAQVQKHRQDTLGLGWANHDHHTYRSSRQCFTRLVSALEKLGFYCRERFYAGHDAGWGAQVLEQPVTGVTIFADVDMSPEELLGDFSHHGFEKDKGDLGTVGLWCGLHGEAILQAGMHHLECQFDHAALVQQLQHEGGIRTMAPFTTFPYLRQAFTEGETWEVSESRLARLVKQGHITAQQAAAFRGTGALGSHLENLERNDGFKGFNQQGVSDIIARTDPRKAAALALSGA